jgi:hypothetical protein
MAGSISGRLKSQECETNDPKKIVEKCLDL